MATSGSVMHRWGRRAVVLAAAAFAAVSVVALATHDITRGGGADLATVGDVAAAPDTVGSTGSAPEPGANPDGTRPFDAGLDTAIVGLPPIDGAVAADDTTGVAGSGGSTPGSEPSDDVALVGPLLRVFSFGSKIGMPLLCNVGSANLSTALAPTGVSPIIATIAESCVTYGSQGSDALVALDLQLRSLAAANPALLPAIQAFADIFNQMGATDVPFADSLTALGQFIIYFADV